MALVNVFGMQCYVQLILTLFLSA